jgi:hypothetical protein
MGIFARIVKNFIRKPIIDERSEFIFYRIIDSEKEDHYLIQCINTHRVFNISIDDLILDDDILYGLHPAQACYIGIEYGKIKSHNPKVFPELQSRYGFYELSYIDRKKNLGFFNKKTNKVFLMPIHQVAFLEHFIGEFDAIQAFYIGFLVGLDFKKLGDIPTNNNSYHKIKNLGLRIVKGGKA